MVTRQMTNEAVEQQIVALLRSGPMKQVDIVDAFPLDMYMVVAKVVRDMDARGIVVREKCGSTKMVTLAESQGQRKG